MWCGIVWLNHILGFCCFWFFLFVCLFVSLFFAQKPVYKVCTGENNRCAKIYSHNVYFMFIVLLYLLILSHYNIAVNNYFKRSLSALFLLCLYSDSLKVSLFVYNSMICKSHIIMYCLVEYKVDIFCNFRCWIHLFWKFIYSKKEKWIDFWHTLLPKWAEIIHVHFLSVGLSRGRTTISKTQKKLKLIELTFFTNRLKQRR